MYTESGHGAKVDVTDEEYAIGAVIMNRWEFVNKNWNLYSYAWSNPLQYLDPSGLACIYSGSGGTGDPNNYYDDDSGGQSCADAFASPPQQVTVADNYSWLDALSFSSWTYTGNIQDAGIGLLGAAGSNFLQNVTNIKLQNIISNLYKPGAQIGSGSTMDAIRNQSCPKQHLS